jgi:hypothetical protein
MEENKLRSSNLELFRIIAMILIVAHHYVVNSGLLNCITSDVTSAKSLFLLIFGWAGKTGINCFVLITGYFMCTSKITLRKGLKLLLEVELYKILIFIIFLATSYVDFSFKLMLKSILPITSLKTGFVSCYLVFFCFIPFLNILIHAMNQKQHITLTSLCLCIFSIFPCLHINITYSYVSWFMVIYLISSYIRLYPPKVFSNQKLIGILMLLCISCSWLSIYIGTYIYQFTGKNLIYFLVADSNKPLAVLTAVVSFLFFKNLKIGYSKFINTIAASAFGVLLIHANSDTMRQWLWKDILDNVGHYNSNIFLHAILCVLGIYIICTIIDFIRIHTIEKIFFKYFDSFMKRDNLIKGFTAVQNKYTLIKKLL